MHPDGGVVFHGQLEDLVVAGLRIDLRRPPGIAHSRQEWFNARPNENGWPRRPASAASIGPVSGGLTPRRNLGRCSAAKRALTWPIATLWSPSGQVRGGSPRTGAVEGTMMGSPAGPGLYDPRNEHDSCGVGFVVNIKGRKSHDIIRRGLQILVNLDHRGAVGADPLVGDGAGCLIQMPEKLLRDWAEEHDLTLPPLGRYAVAMCFLPQDANARDFAIRLFEHYIPAEGQTLLGWRDVPTDT